MPKVVKLKKADIKAAPYPSAAPTAGASTTSTPSVPLTKKERKKARRSSLALASSATLAEPSQNSPQSSSLPARRKPSSSTTRTDSAATDGTVKSEPAATGASPAAEEKKRRKKERKQKKRESLLVQSMPVKTEDDGVMEVDVAPVAAYPQPGVKVESSADVVARLTAKPRRKDKRVKTEPKPDVGESSAQAEPAKLTLLKDNKASIWEKRLEEVKREAETEKAEREKEREEMVAKLREAEEKLEAHKLESAQQIEEKDKSIEKNAKTLDTLREAASCRVCLDYLKDPHILACGHIACKECLTSWFRTSAAFLHRIPDLGDNLVPNTRDVSYRTKLCHTCRVPIFRRPSRMYHFDSILEPLGINPQIPSLSQDARDTADPWRNLFPREHDSYRVHDDDGHIERCPECNSEIEDSFCEGCNIEFSESEGEGEMLSEGSEIGDEHGDDVDASEEDSHLDDGHPVPGEPGYNEGEAEARRAAREEVAAAARVDRQIREQARRIADQRNLMDLEASTDGDDEEDDEEADPWGGGGARAVRDSDADEDDSNDEVVMMHRQEFRNRDLYDEDDPEHYESYESSFIDDDEEEEVDEVEDGEDSLMIGQKDTNADVEPDAEEMRKRRLARFDAKVAAESEADRSVSPVIMRAPASARRRTVVESDSE